MDALALALEKLGYTDERFLDWKFAVRDATRNGRKDLVERLLRLRSPQDLADDLGLGTRLMLAAPDQRLAMMEQEAQAGLREANPVRLVEFAYDLLDSEVPALGILVTRSILPIASHFDAITVFDVMIQARDRLGLPVADPFDDLLDHRLLGEENPAGGPSHELRAAQDNLETKAQDIRKLTEEIQRLHRELETRPFKPQPRRLKSRGSPQGWFLQAVLSPWTTTVPPFNSGSGSTNSALCSRNGTPSATNCVASCRRLRRELRT